MTKKITQVLLAVGLVMLFGTMNFAADFTYTDDANALATMNQIVDRLNNASGLQLPVHILIQHFDDVNAFSSAQGQIIVTQGLLRAITTEEELAGAIAHEMGHMVPVYAHKGIRNFNGFGGDEFNADKRGIEILEKAGYNPIGLAEMLKVVLERGMGTFPKSQARQISDRIHKVEKVSRHFEATAVATSASAM